MRTRRAAQTARMLLLGAETHVASMRWWLALFVTLPACGDPHRFTQPERPDVTIAVHDAGLLEAPPSVAPRNGPPRPGFKSAWSSRMPGAVRIRWGDSGGLGNGGTEDPASGDIEINPGLDGDGYLDRIVAHEIGHALEKPRGEPHPGRRRGADDGRDDLGRAHHRGRSRADLLRESPRAACVALRSE